MRAIADRLRGPEPAQPVDDSWTESVNLVVLAAHPDRNLLITSAQASCISFVPPVPVIVIWNWLKDQHFTPPSDMPFQGDDTCKVSQPMADAAFAASGSQQQQEPTIISPGDQEVDPLSD